MTETDDPDEIEGARASEVIPFSRAPSPNGPASRDGYRAFELVRLDLPRPFMLELRFANGNAECFAYRLLAYGEFDPSAGLVLEFGVGRVTITGRNLRPLSDGVAANRVIWIAEADDLEAVARDPAAAVVTGIVVEAAG